jgi:hypothetical protein
VDGGRHIDRPVGTVTYSRCSIPEVDPVGHHGGAGRHGRFVIGANGPRDLAWLRAATCHLTAASR